MSLLQIAAARSRIAASKLKAVPNLYWPKRKRPGPDSLKGRVEDIHRYCDTRVCIRNYASVDESQREGYGATSLPYNLRALTDTPSEIWEDMVTRH